MSAMTVSTMRSVQRALVIGFLLVVLVAGVVVIVMNMPKLFTAGPSLMTMLAGLHLLGLAVLSLLWMLLRLFGGTTVHLLLLPGRGVRVEEPGRTVELRGVKPDAVTIGRFASWYWLQIRASQVVLNGVVKPRGDRVTVPVAGPRSHVEQVAGWVRAGLGAVAAG